MTKRTVEGNASGDRARREEREKRILSAAIILLQKWGYRKTTLDDIAREAGVAKGTIYLSWPTRERLFMALIEREQTSLLQEILLNMEEDPEGLSLVGLIKHSLLASLHNPVMRALITQDTDFLGQTFTREIKTASYQTQITQYLAIIEQARQAGVIRDDLDIREQALAVVSASWGPLLINPLLPGELHLSDQQMVSLILTILKRLLEPDQPPTEEQQEAGREIFRAYMQQLATHPLEL